MPIFEEKFIQIDGDTALTNKGRLFRHLTTIQTDYWIELDLPDFQENSKGNQINFGKTQFIESVSDKEKFNKAKNITDLI